MYQFEQLIIGYILNLEASCYEFLYMLLYGFSLSRIRRQLPCPVE